MSYRQKDDVESKRIQYVCKSMYRSRDLLVRGEMTVSVSSGHSYVSTLAAQTVVTPGSGQMHPRTPACSLAGLTASSMRRSFSAGDLTRHHMLGPRCRLSLRLPHG
ncbi:hypothetical protein OH76DRAFT_899614 [Lentinus brumalis]|uniref:Uncharacterized protein n=1 Tax=Lentinus brumalis TaxID=2498619 RepID=A0A371D0U0_9APHY|nr:hypothetical protein OH76DRAFT_899614 [Polyporus brumalis]